VPGHFIRKFAAGLFKLLAGIVGLFSRKNGKTPLTKNFSGMTLNRFGKKVQYLPTMS
jgi:hypothetical protein